MGIFASALKMRRLTSVGNPPAGVDAFYFKENGLPYIRNSEGVERALIQPDSAMHSNPSFEEGATAPGNDLMLFWQNGGTHSYDTVDFVDGTRSLKTVWSSSAATHIGTNEIRVVPGSVIEGSIWSKASVAGNITIHLFTGSEPGTQFFSPSTQQSSNHTLGTSWRRASAQFTVPAGHSYARFFWSPNNDRTVWLDASGSKVVYTPPPTDETGVIKIWPTLTPPAGYLFCDGSEQPVATYPQLDALLGTTYGPRTNGSGGAGSTHFRLPNLSTRLPDTDWTNMTLVNGWGNYGGQFQVAQYRRRNGNVELRGLITGNARTNPTFWVAPAGFRHAGNELIWDVASDSAGWGSRVDSQGTTRPSPGAISLVTGNAAYLSLSQIRYASEDLTPFMKHIIKT